MDGISISAPRGRGHIWSLIVADPRYRALALFTIIALLLRGPYFGNPDYHVDEEFYFLVADRMWHGALPFVDIWDRKPIGLFLIYALLWPLRHTDMLAVQLAATGFVTATSYVIWQICRRQLTNGRACIPAVLYLFWLSAFGGGNGQSPIFYNLFVAAACLLLFRAGDEEGVTPRFERNGYLAMLLVGLAIQVKYTAVVEGAFFGLYFVILAAKRGISFARLTRLTIFGVLCALGPTLLVMLVYAILGHLDAFLFANFFSIFLRAKLEAHYLEALIDYILIIGLPLFLVTFAALLINIFGLSRIARGPRRDHILLIGWVAAALGGFLSIGNFYDHYALPLFPPLFALSASLFEVGSFGLLWAALLAVWPLYWSGLLASPSAETMRSRATISALTQEIRPYLKHGKLFVYDGPSFLYVSTGADIPTPYAYPDHLSNLVEQNALGIDTGREMQRIIAARPAVIVTSDKGLIPLWNMTTRRQVNAALARDYVEIDRRLGAWSRRYYIVNVRRDLAQGISGAKPAHLGLSKSLQDSL
jgi:hypothetical protein